MGGPFLDGDATPRAVTRAYFEKICPHPTLVREPDVREMYPPGSSAVKIVETWRDHLATIDDPCVEVTREGNIFTILYAVHFLLLLLLFIFC